MKKVKRYYDQENSDEIVAEKKQVKRKNETVEDIVRINVKLHKNTWGRRKEEKRVKKVPNKNAKFPGRVPIKPEALLKHSRGTGLSQDGVRTGVYKKKLERKEDNIKFAHEQAARTEVLLTEDAGYLEADDGETTTQFKQTDIVDSLDISAATKHFDLRLNDFGPYRAKYTRNGRHLLLGGKLGHVAAFDWVTKKLHCELNVMETVHDISWLHIETMFAVAQKDWVYVYDNQGIELHCIKRLNKVSRMEFLPYHFLLATASDEGYLSWLDISIGKLVSQFNSKYGKLSMMTQNPYNAVLCLGHSKGIVSMWSPNVREPIAKMLCHRAPLSAVHIDPKGIYMATGSVGSEIKIWDCRKLEGPLQTYKVHSAPHSLNLSQNGMMAVGTGNIVEVYRECCNNKAKRPYIRHRFDTTISNMNFCPYEDVLGVATSRGFTSLIVPGAGEANFDGFEANPFQTKSQRREFEVKALLEKIQPELITLDPTTIAEVDVPTLKDKVENKKKLLYIKPPKINYEPRNKAKGRGGTAKIARNKKIVKEQAKKNFLKTMKNIKTDATQKPAKKKSSKATDDVLDRFKPN